jgi:hypothetical protein
VYISCVDALVLGFWVSVGFCLSAGLVAFLCFWFFGQAILEGMTGDLVPTGPMP